MRKTIAGASAQRDVVLMNERSTGPISKNPITTIEEKSSLTGKVLPFPERSCAQCAFVTEAGGVTDHHQVLARLKTHTPYEGFSFLPQALQRWRERRGLKISAAAQGLGVAASTWGHWETGFRFPTGSVLLDLVQYTGMSLVELICEHAEQCPFKHALKPTAPAGLQGA